MKIEQHSSQEAPGGYVIRLRVQLLLCFAQGPEFGQFGCTINRFTFIVLHNGRNLRAKRQRYLFALGYRHKLTPDPILSFRPTHRWWSHPKNGHAVTCGEKRDSLNKPLNKPPTPQCDSSDLCKWFCWYISEERKGRGGCWCRRQDTAHAIATRCLSEPPHHSFCPFSTQFCWQGRR